jgi:hypothetical protein
MLQPIVEKEKKRADEPASGEGRPARLSKYQEIAKSREGVRYSLSRLAHRTNRGQLDSAGGGSVGTSENAGLPSWAKIQAPVEGKSDAANGVWIGIINALFRQTTMYRAGAE